MTDKGAKFLDAWNELFGGLSSLLSSDAVMSALSGISLDEGVTANDVLLGISQNYADVDETLKQEMR